MNLHAEPSELQDLERGDPLGDLPASLAGVMVVKPLIDLVVPTNAAERRLAIYHYEMAVIFSLMLIVLIVVGGMLFFN